MAPWSWPQKKFNVTFDLSGQHPYLDRRDYPDRSETVTVLARHWNDAEKVAIRELPRGDWWQASVAKIERVRSVIKVGGGDV